MHAGWLSRRSRTSSERNVLGGMRESKLAGASDPRGIVELVMKEYRDVPSVRAWLDDPKLGTHWHRQCHAVFVISRPSSFTI